MKRRKEQQAPQPQPEEKVLDVTAAMQGSLRFDDPVNLRISGKFEGTLDTKGKLMVGEKAEIKANISGESIFIEGAVTGNILATKLLKLGKTARLNGDVETPSLGVQEGAIIAGQIRMERSSTDSTSSSDRISLMDIYEVSKYLEIDKGKINEWATNGALPATQEDGEWKFEKEKIDQWVAQGKIKG